MSESDLFWLPLKKYRVKSLLQQRFWKIVEKFMNSWRHCWPLALRCRKCVKTGQKKTIREWKANWMHCKKFRIPNLVKDAARILEFNGWFTVLFFSKNSVKIMLWLDFTKYFQDFLVKLRVLFRFFQILREIIFAELRINFCLFHTMQYKSSSF